MSKQIVQERLLNAPVARVYAAWTDPASLSIWMGPGPDFSHASVSADVRVGGSFEIVMHADQDYRQTGRYLEVVPERRLVFEWISHWLPAGESRTRVTVEFEAVDETRTRIRLVHDLLPESNSYDGHSEGWSTILMRLDHTLQGGSQ